MSDPTFVPAFDRDGDELWMSPDGWMHHVRAVGTKPDPAIGWRRLYVQVPAKETPTAEVAASLAADAARVMAELRLARVDTPSFLVLAIRELRQVDGQRQRLTAYTNAVRDAIRAAEAEAYRMAERMRAPLPDETTGPVA